MTEPCDASRMRATHDERLALPIEQGVLLWCMRTWVIGIKRGIAVEARVDEMLERWAPAWHRPVSRTSCSHSAKAAPG